MLRLIEKGKCLPVSLEEARRHLSIDSSDRNNDQLIEMLIAAAANDAEMRTSRTWVSSKWDWKPENITVNRDIEFPLVPVTKVEVFDLDQVLGQDETYTDISGEVVLVSYPSPEPQGRPLIGSLLPLSGFPTNYQIVLTVGYPVKESITEIRQNEPPELVAADTRYTANKIALVFSRPVEGRILPENFSVIKDGVQLSLVSSTFREGRVELEFDPETFSEGNSVEINFVGGSIYDSFSNFLQPIIGQILPDVVVGTEGDFITPQPNPTESVFVSECPEAVKNWILTRVGTLYNQRSELALRVGATTNAMFPDQFIDCLLYPYKTVFV